MEEELIPSYWLEVTLSTHSAEEFEYEAIAHLPVDIRDALPYLNAVLDRAIYLPDGPALAWRQEEHNIGFWPDRIAVDHLHSRGEARQAVEELIGLVNRVWARRGEIEPDARTHTPLKPLEVYRLLPQTNCGLCGEATCFTFALKVAARQAKAEECRPLYEEAACADQRARLEALLAPRGTG